MTKHDDSPPVGQKCSTTARHLQDMAYFRRKLKTEMREAERYKRHKGEGADGAIVKLLPLYLKLVAMEQELLARSATYLNATDEADGEWNGGKSGLDEDDWEILAYALQSRKPVLCDGGAPDGQTDEC